MIAAVVAMISVIAAVGGSIEESYNAAIGNLSQPWEYRALFDDLKSAECFAEVLNSQMPETSSAINLNAQMEGRINGLDYYIRIGGVRGDLSASFNNSLIEGGYPEEATDILVDNAYRTYIDPECSVGDGIAFKILSPVSGEYFDVTYRICGFFVTQHSDVTNMTAYMDIDSVLDLLSGSQEGYTYSVSVKNAGDYEKISDAMNVLLNYFKDEYGTEYKTEWDERVITNSKLLDLTGDRKNSGSVSLVFVVLGIFIGFSSLFMFINLFQMTYPDKVRKYGVIRSLGLDRKQMIVSLLLELDLYIVCGAALGLAFYKIIETIYGEIIIKSFLHGFDLGVDINWHFSLSAFGWSVLLIILIVLGVDAWVMIRNMRISPIEAMHYLGETGRIGSLGKMKKNPVMAVGSRNIRRSKWRSVYTAVNIFIVTLLLCTFGEVLGCMDPDDNIIYTKSNMFDYEFFKDDGLTYLTAANIEYLRSLDCITNLCVGRTSTHDFYPAPGQAIAENSHVQIRIYEDEIFERICNDNGWDLDGNDMPVYLQLLNAENIPLSEVVLRDGSGNEISINGIISIQADPFNLTTLAGVDSLVLVMNEAAGKQLFEDYDINYVFVASDNEHEAYDMITGYFDSIGIDMYYSDLKDMTKVMRDSLRSMLSIGIYVMTCLALMTLVNIICNITLNVRMRSREYGIIRALGMERKDIVKLIVYEVVSVSTFAVIIAMVMSIPVSSFLLYDSYGTNILKQIVIGISCGAGIYLAMYYLCTLIGKEQFSKNIVGLTRQE
ncbi:MAG: ABC transporter permease [Lachnospiraceae bacterium]|nr:ABC transporter permease [Lachnospiraceae bacterium]